MGLDQRVAIVTGGSRGIGAATARCLAASGYRVVISYLHHEQKAQAVLQDILGHGVGGLAIAADVTNASEVNELVQQTLAAFGRIDVLVNNAGITADRTIRKLDSDLWQQVLNVNLTGPYHCIRSVLPAMISQSYGRIINISSIIAHTGGYGQTNYSASKAGLLGLTRSVALEVAKNGITVNAVCPGFVETEMLQQVPQEVRDTILKRIPLGRFGRTEEVADAVLFTARASWMTGQCLNLNGGQDM